jgi:hypothetical protein
LESDQLGSGHGGEDFGHLGLAHSRLALEEQGAAQLNGEMDGDEEALIGEVVEAVETLL